MATSSREGVHFATRCSPVAAASGLAPNISSAILRGLPDNFIASLTSMRAGTRAAMRTFQAAVSRGSGKPLAPGWGS